MTPWKLADGKIKNYKHFDSVMTVKQAETLANDPILVQKHAFYPFITYEKRWTQFSKKGIKSVAKTRPIAYAARSDAYIYARYRALLSDIYEKRLCESGLSKCVLAYRKIVDQKTGAGKSNINFANEAFETIRSFGSCCAIALDISKYFQSIDHKQLFKRWCDLIGKTKLPGDHLKVFNSITNYSEVDKIKVYERLGYYGKIVTADGKTRTGYLRPQCLVSKQLCDAKSFRNKIAGQNGKPSIIKKNTKEHGIPQGSPISDILANIYLLEFDKLVNEYVEKRGGVYTRYSDDILVIAPVSAEQALEVERYIRELIKNFGTALKIKQEKSTILEFYTVENRREFRIIYDGKSKLELKKQLSEELLTRGLDLELEENKILISNAEEQGRSGLNGIDYLGFRFDGKKIFLRDSTFANLRRKIRIRTKIEARKFIAERPTLNRTELVAMFESRTDFILESFGRIRDFETRDLTRSDWTFWTYVNRIAKTMDPKLSRIPHQLRNLKKIIREEADMALKQAVAAGS
jgi:Reverse transcriptase (RNA-dependent DNA polymerase)